ncbi:C-C motif chemokine 3-like [Silurus meridionalis]|uniref:C-C motif chemokine 3-like n=1 Tax=Silurus meridionalis TaxID=175797 RepID=UPI001EEB794A|nr:C-C motif chemokine 3-like [Silurus meridionalis]
MISRGLLLGLLVLTCLQLFTKALNANGPDQCCFRYQRNPIPIRVITGYKVTERHCAKPAVIFTLMNSRQVCVDPDLEWVQRHMRRIDQMEYNRMIQSTNSTSQS